MAVEASGRERTQGVRRSLYMLGATVREGGLFTLHYMHLNRFRTILSLLGISVGIFTIMAILVAVYTLKMSIMKEFSQLDSKSIYIDARPWIFTGDAEEWFRMRNNKPPDYNDYRALQRLSANVGKVGMVGEQGGVVVKYNLEAVEQVNLCGVLPNCESLVDMTVAKGRGFSFRELTGSSNICLLGHRVAKELFGDNEALGEEVRVDGFRLRVVGVLREQGNRMFTRSTDNGLIVPYGFAVKLYGERSLSNLVAVVPAEGVALAAVEGELRRIMRASRKIVPGKPDNFALNRLDAMVSTLDKEVSTLNKAAVFLGGFSVLIGAFGIANIMLVSVQERIKIIGIQKALGARSRFILLQFLIEAMLLSLLGGIVALIFLWLLAMGVSSFSKYDVAMRWWHAALGCGLSLVVGLLAGLIPARRASELQPVVAIEGLSGTK